VSSTVRDVGSLLRDGKTASARNRLRQLHPLVSACSSSAFAPAVLNAPPSSPALAAAPSATASADPLVLAHFPSTTDGRLARSICRQWERLRAEYYYRVQVDTPYQLNQWSSSSDWTTEYSDANEFGDDPAYVNIESSLGAGLVGDMANVAAPRP
jgi:hypothetical protein